MKNQVEKAKVLLVGTFHMGATNNMHNNTEVPDILTPKKQEEIRVVIDRLKKFNPTKIALEIVTKDDEVINNKYNEYLNGEFELEVNERYQLGFRIAEELDHKKIHPIDWMEVGVATRPYGAVYEWAKKNQSELFDEVFIKKGNLFKTNENDSILEMYKTCNNPDNIKKSQDLYINMARVGNVGEYVGIDWLIWWYQRNLILFSNISRLASSEEERILVLIGASHIYLLEQFLRESDTVELIDVNRFLGE